MVGSEIRMGIKERRQRQGRQGGYVRGTVAAAYVPHMPSWGFSMSLGKGTAMISP
jgi:hypothetical protein